MPDQPDAARSPQTRPAPEDPSGPTPLCTPFPLGYAAETAGGNPSKSMPVPPKPGSSTK